jgi:hypothetical protein
MCPVSKRHMPCLPECGNQIRCYEPIGNPYQAARILFDQRLRMNHRRHLDDSKALRPAQQIITQSPISLICNALQAVRRRNRSKSGRVDRSQPAIPCRCTYKRLNVEIYGSRPTKKAPRLDVRVHAFLPLPFGALSEVHVDFAFPFLA